MYRNPDPYIPRSTEEIRDFLSSMMLNAPTFVDPTGFFYERNLESEFFALSEGLESIRSGIGDESYFKLAELTSRMRAHFEADPEDKTGETTQGRECIREMLAILRQGGGRKR